MAICLSSKPLIADYMCKLVKTLSKISCRLPPLTDENNGS